MATDPLIVEKTSVEETSEEPRDAVGAATLELLQKHDAYSCLIWERMMSLGQLEGRVLEIGCGFGSFSRLILDRETVTRLESIDVEPAYVEALREKITDERFVVSCTPAESHEAEAASFDRALSINVFEHIEDDGAAMERVARALRPGGEFWILVPAHPALFCGLDRGLSHYRRYTRRALRVLAEGQGLRVERMFHFNPVGACGWWFTGKMLRRAALPESQVSLYSRFGIAISRLSDRLNPFPFGISLIARLVKPD